MEKNTKLLLGRILGEIYRIQKNTEEMACPASRGRIYGLINGFEEAIDEELKSIGFISTEEVLKMQKVLDDIYHDPKKLAEFKGFYDIENTLNSMGIDRGKAMQILTYFAADKQYDTLIEKMDSSGSPSECRRFELSEFDR